MLLFLLCYLGIYGGAHAFIMWRVVRVFQLPAPWPPILVALSIFLVLAPVLVRILERIGRERPARVVAWLGYLWMGFFFLLLSAALPLELVRGGLALAGLLLPSAPELPELWLFSLALLAALAGSIYGIFEARGIRVERLTLTTPKLAKGTGRVRVALISDVHLGLMVGKEGLGRILAAAEAEQPDLLLSAGDLVDGQMDGIWERDRELSAVSPPLGKFAVLGNHEVFAGVTSSVDFTKRCGFRLLRGEAVELPAGIILAGVDDPALRGGAAQEQKLLASLPRDRFIILLKHRPAVDPQSRGLFDLQLSGHVHKGQIFPFNLITRLVYPAKMGLSDAGSASFLYVSRGSGTWGPPMRVLAPPEVTIIDIVPS